MSDQDDQRGSSGDLGEEAARLIGAVQQRVVRGVMSTAASAGKAAATGSRDNDDVWSRATAEPEGDVSPIDRLMDFSKVAGPRVAGHLFQAGTALFAAARDLVDAYQETRPVRPGPDAGPDPERFVDAGSDRARVNGDPWAAAADDVPRPSGPRRDDPDDGVEHIDIG
ncbi:MAG TPA: hypothetical protein VGL93_35855 [Streptosporangiaceae bacterium]|jgi:hypothetical protein